MVKLRAVVLSKGIAEFWTKSEGYAWWGLALAKCRAVEPWLCNVEFSNVSAEILKQEKQSMMNRERFKCYGYVKDGRKGCRWLDKSPSESECFSCSFYKTKLEYETDLNSSAQMLMKKRLRPVIKVIYGQSIMSTEIDE